MQNEPTSKALPALSSIIVAEDDAFDAEFTIGTLKEIPLSNPIVHLLDGEAVLDYLYSTGPYKGQNLPDPAILILDIKMPKVTGIEVLRQIKADKTKQHIPVIMLTYSMEVRDVIESYGLGANSYVTKPVDLKQFEEAVSVLGLHWAIVNVNQEMPAKKKADSMRIL